MHKEEKTVEGVEHVIVDKLPSGVKVEARKLDSSLMILSCSILLAALLISGTLLYTKSGTSGVPVAANVPAGAVAKQKVDVSSGVTQLLGVASAKVTIVEFGDFQCPYCIRFFNDTFGQIKKEYIDTGKVKYAYRHYPLPMHPGAAPAALAALCANDQGKYWEMHDKIFNEQVAQGAAVQMIAASFKKWARDLGMNGTTFDQCMDAKKYEQQVQTDMADGSKVGVQGTPAFFVNGRLLSGAQPFAQFKALIDEELAASGTGGPLQFIKGLF